MAKLLDLNHTVYELTKEYPELISIMADLGFTEITKVPMLHSVGKLMTIPKGAKMKHIPMDKILDAFRSEGFEVTGFSEDLSPEAPSQNAPAAPSAEDRNALLKSYLRRLGEGDDLEAVRADFVANFADVDAAEIMQAEQELLSEGTPLEEVQRLCDVHSALFHGATREEKIANAERAVTESLSRGGTDVSATIAATLAAMPGHPLGTFGRENDAITAHIAEARRLLESGEDAGEQLARVREAAIHYAKKGDLLYPLLKVKYDIIGPSEVMWTVDDEIRDEFAALTGAADRDDTWKARAEAVLTRAEEMIFKEQNILFPLCASKFSEEEWMHIYRDAKDYASVCGVVSGIWDKAEQLAATSAVMNDGEVVMPGGHLTVAQLTAILNTLPLEISFVDAENINRYFNESPKVFKRPNMAIDRDVFSCHPPKVETIVRGIINSFRAGTSDTVPVWMEKGGRPMLVTYMAVRDRDKNYLGTMEIVQDMSDAKAHFEK